MGSRAKMRSSLVPFWCIISAEVAGFQRTFGIDNCVEWLVIDLDQIERILCFVGISRDRHRDRLTDETDLVLREYGMMRQMLYRCDAWNRTNSVLDVHAGKYAYNTRGLTRCIGVNRFDFCVC